jgi:hypothetical protein
MGHMWEIYGKKSGSIWEIDGNIWDIYGKYINIGHMGN